MSRVDVTQILAWSLGLVAFWGGAVVVHALWRSSQRRFDPLAADPPEPHHHDHDELAVGGHGPAHSTAHGHAHH